ncbi:polysaccharide deacetylase [Erythrobacter litoralis]|uniref:polysaccharide deacetylase family protein n=1 Tax=Erythrobacter litoralis TaxID=39960 RepID=UPI0024360C40|nr:polysaccharide deacetylase family protein [Erythrobacter litoralis]MDG6077901.1 polysaccharide deacetylase [Erythrobacter litoralis]
MSSRTVLSLCLILLVGVPSAALAEKRVALTFDDVPRSAGAFLSPDERTARIIAALEESGVEQAAFFVNPGNLSTADGANGDAHISAYVAAGHVIANHSFSHPHLRTSDVETYLADIDRAEAWLKGREGYRPWFRFPYLDEGGRDLDKRDAIRADLAARGLRNGYVTADGSDWHLEQLTLDAKAAGKTINMTQLARLYIGAQLSALEYHDQLARDTIGRSPAHVLLMHETDLAALFLPELVDEMRKQGWTIIAAEEAYADPIAAEQPDVPYAYGTLIGSMAWERDVPPPAYPLWMSTDMMSLLFDRRVVEKAAETED